MEYRVDIAPAALQDAEDAYLWIKAQASSEVAGEWYEGLLAAIFTLERSPLRCALAPESEDLGREIRQLLYGKRGSTEPVVRLPRVKDLRQRSHLVRR
jgi:plasmid stabilization system protein ParE